MYKLSKIYYLTLWTILFAPSLVKAWVPGEPIVPPCARVDYVSESGPGCGFADIMTLIDTLLSVVIWLAVPISTVLFAWIGWDFITQGDKASARSSAKTRLTTLLKGMFFILAPVLIIKMIVSGLGDKGDVLRYLD